MTDWSLWANTAGCIIPMHVYWSLYKVMLYWTTTVCTWWLWWLIWCDTARITSIVELCILPYVCKDNTCSFIQNRLPFKECTKLKRDETSFVGYAGLLIEGRSTQFLLSALTFTAMSDAIDVLSIICAEYWCTPFIFRSYNLNLCATTDHCALTLDCNACLTQRSIPTCTGLLCICTDLCWMVWLLGSQGIAQLRLLCCLCTMWFLNHTLLPDMTGSHLNPMKWIHFLVAQWRLVETHPPVKS